VLPNLVDAGDLTQETVDEIFATSFAFDQKSQKVSFSNRAELFQNISTNMNKVLAAPTVHGGIESLLGPGYFMPPWNTHLHINGVGDEYAPGHTGYHADGTDHGPTQSTVRDHRPRQIFGFFYPGDVPMSHGPTAVLPQTQYKTVDRVHPWNQRHEVNSEDLLTIEMLPVHLRPDWNEDELMGSKVLFEAHDDHRVRVAAEALGEPPGSIEEIKLTCKAGTVVLVHQPP
jgi:hypothetical protein